jgi:hypothetical protein
VSIQWFMSCFIIGVMVGFEVIFLTWFYWWCYSGLVMFHSWWFKMILIWGLMEHVQQWPLLYLFITLEHCNVIKINNHLAIFFRCHILHTCQPSYFEQIYVNPIHCQWSTHYNYPYQLKRGLKLWKQIWKPQIKPKNMKSNMKTNLTIGRFENNDNNVILVHYNNIFWTKKNEKSFFHV